MVRISYSALSLLLLLSSSNVSSFQLSAPSLQQRNNIVAKKNGDQPSLTSRLDATATDVDNEKKLQERKKELLTLLLGSEGSSKNNENGIVDPVLCDPVTKEQISVVARGNNVVLGGQESNNKGITFELTSPSNKYSGSSDTFLNLLTPVDEDANDNNDNDNSNFLQRATRQLAPLIPPQLRSVLSVAGIDDSYIPMRDLFTSPSVSFAYERGWRQGFASAGFPGADREFVMATEYFAPVASSDGAVVVDMSCATGLFTRRFAAKDTYGRVLGCDYSDAMLTEARRRINNADGIKKMKTTQLDLVQLDVGQIPMSDGSVDALHAGAAMHCWPDLDAAISEIYRVLKPGGRYFATTFLSTYFSVLNTQNDDSTPISQLAFQNFKSTDTLKELLVRNGFDSDKTSLEVLGAACVVIRAEK